ncbi:hypothetical protein OIU84_014920 [Salix udensis]|uniref:Uncharacterized protein n=1 Tax=Salix udensis TaxID=889485 RepID=A0AAD6JD73_9ROSI|nr:hypothetical protein OIU84_014920 [Salix udensis]
MFILLIPVTITIQIKMKTKRIIFCHEEKPLNPN